MFKSWSLSARLVSTVAVTVAIALLLFGGVTAFRLQDGVTRQEQAVVQLARERFDAQLQLEVQLASSFLERISNDVDVAVAGLAERSETKDAVKRGNIVAIDLLMQKVVRNSPLDGVLVLDVDLHALGSQQPGLNLLEVNRVLDGAPLAKVLRTLLDNQDPEAARSHQAYEPTSPTFLKTMGLAFQPNAMLLVSVHPVFDDFGDVMALLFGLKTVSREEPVLKQFARTWELAIQVFDGAISIMQLGGSKANIESRNLLSSCAPFANRWRLCVSSPGTKLQTQTRQLVGTIEQEKASLMRWLIALCLLSVLFASLLASVATRRVLAPLENITRVVRSVAKGNWLARVAGQKRRDEVGEIARAVVVLQKSVKEREQLQASVLDVEQVVRQRRDLADAMQACRSVLRQRLFGLSDVTDRVEQGAQKLVGLSGFAEGEADEARLVVLRAFPKEADSEFDDREERARFVRDAIERLGETVVKIGSNGRDVAAEVSGLVADVRGLDHVVKRFLGDLDSVPELPEAELSAKVSEKA